MVIKVVGVDIDAGSLEMEQRFFVISDLLGLLIAIVLGFQHAQPVLLGPIPGMDASASSDSEAAPDL